MPLPGRRVGGDADDGSGPGDITAALLHDPEVIYLDDRTNEPEWATVNTGLFGTSQSFVPLSGATVTDDGLTVQYSKDQIKDAPRVDAGEHLGVLGARARGVVGDVVVAMAENWVLVDPRVHSEAAIAMPGVHGSFTPAETEVPLLITET